MSAIAFGIRTCDPGPPDDGTKYHSGFPIGPPASIWPSTSKNPFSSGGPYTCNDPVSGSGSMLSPSGSIAAVSSSQSAAFVVIPDWPVGVGAGLPASQASYAAAEST